ncbi:MAG: prenyltransferase [Desulfovibrio sp.]|nr:prenyltransferase [Desulfovibrio sp.]MDY5485873.1 prenyltransferase [Desulfovibrio sp.]MEE0405409.1 prenyltransferase [Desulfovibrio sp.]
MTASEIMSRTLAGRPEGIEKPSAAACAKAWWRACRPPFLITAAIPVALAMAFVYRVNGGLTAAMWLRFGVLLFGCFLGLTIANFANDLFDHVLGVDDQEDSIGGTGVIQAGLITCRQFFFAILFLCAATLAIGVGLIVTLPGSLRPVLLFLAVFAVASAVFYVAPPIRYGHRGLGEVMVGINLGLIVVSASATIIAQSFDIRSLAVALPVVGMVAGILYYQSLPEIDTDKAGGKTTLANILGKDHALLVFRIWWPVVWVSIINLWLSGLAGWPVLFCLVGLPLYWKAQKLIAARGDGDWLELDRYGYLVRLCYLTSGISCIVGVAL